jgi:RhtB (resistance to homoserine/threonine) family protein
VEYLPLILTVALVHLLAVMSPGPDFIMIMRNALVYSRRSGIFVAMGLGLGILVHVAYSIAGIALIISQSVMLFNVLKLIGAGYLIYIGIKSLSAKAAPAGESHEAHQHRDQTRLQAIRTGFITNVTNPKATMFFLSLFTLIIQPTTPLAVKVIMGLEMSVATCAWFTFVAVLAGHPAVRRKFARIQHHVEHAMGAVLILFGLKLALSHAK